MDDDKNGAQLLYHYNIAHATIYSAPIYSAPIIVFRRWWQASSSRRDPPHSVLPDPESGQHPPAPPVSSSSAFLQVKHSSFHRRLATTKMHLGTVSTRLGEFLRIALSRRCLRLVTRTLRTARSRKEPRIASPRWVMGIARKIHLTARFLRKCL